MAKALNPNRHHFFLFPGLCLLWFQLLESVTMPSASLYTRRLAQRLSQGGEEVFFGDRKKEGVIKAESVKQ